MTIGVGRINQTHTNCLIYNVFSYTLYFAMVNYSPLLRLDIPAPSLLMTTGSVTLR